jgi:hypothetical protein
MVYRQALTLLAWSITAAAADRDPALVLQRVAIKQRVRAASLPNYTCVETVTRDYYKSKSVAPKRTCADVLEERRHPGLEMGQRLVLTDRLRLDVTMIERGEIYSWSGASKFEDSGIDEVVHQGPIGTGSFGAFLAVVLAQDLKTFHYLGDTQVAGRNLMEYLFQVEKESSHYQVKTRDSWVYTGYSGSVQVDPETSEVVGMRVQSAELPEESGSCQTTTAMDFRLTRIGDGEFPLPIEGRQRFVDLNGFEVENTTTLADCREYRGESTITFFPEPEPAGGKGRKSAPSPPARVPAGLGFTFELTTPISVDTAAGGDAFAGRLVSALRDKGKTIAPAHALVEGRLLRVEIRRTPPLGAIVVLKLRTVEIGGVKVPLAADIDARQVRGGRIVKAPILLLNSWEQNAAAFPLMGEHAVMKAGTRSDWLTAVAQN